MIASNMRMIACGGLLSVLRHQPGLLFFDISDPAHPRYLFSRQTTLSAVTDDLRPLPDGGFLVTDMGSSTGRAPGRLVELDARMHVRHEWPNKPPAGLNPHGISINFEHNVMLTSDYLDPASTFNTLPGPVVYRGTIRVWNFSRRTIARTITIAGDQGMMDVKFIPADPQARAYNEDGFGKLHVDGDHRVRVFLVGERSLGADPSFNLDFNRVLAGLRLRPHGTDAL